MEAQKANIRAILKKLSDYTRSKTSNTPKELFGVIIEEIPEDDKDENMEVEENKIEFSNKVSNKGGENIDFDVAMECLNALLLNVRTLKKRAEDFSQKTQCVKGYASECLRISQKIKILNDQTQPLCAKFEPRLKIIRKKLADIKIKTGEELEFERRRRPRS
uniref:Biogenesis of lysosome-related organelles complex 1 subunit 7 n=1 Tax=Strongyloides papillosus TaxID=174720 RepID=A0A0N5BUS5_STREA